MNSQYTRKPKSISELWPSPWLKAEDIPRPVRVMISRVKFAEFRQMGGDKALKPVIGFEGKQKQLVANITQCRAIAEITGTEVFDEWPGTEIVLSPGKASNGKPTIIVSAVPPASTGEGETFHG